MNLVFFDFDDTLTLVDTTLPFGAFFAGQLPPHGRVLPLVVALGLFRLRVLSNSGLKRAFARQYLAGQTVADVQQLAITFQQARLDSLTDDGVLGALQMHASRGDAVYLVSANFDCLLEPLMARWSLAGVIATQAECLAGVYTGGISGEACHGEEKLRRAVARLGQAAVSGAVAYGNRDDAPLLRAVRTAYLVRRGRPVPLLARLRRGRRILSGKLSRADLGAAHQIEPFANAGSRGPAAPAEG